jgi:hypothetical protein
MADNNLKEQLEAAILASEALLADLTGAESLYRARLQSGSLFSASDLRTFEQLGFAVDEERSALEKASTPSQFTFSELAPSGDPWIIDSTRDSPPPNAPFPPAIPAAESRKMEPISATSGAHSQEIKQTRTSDNFHTPPPANDPHNSQRERDLESLRKEYAVMQVNLQDVSASQSQSPSDIRSANIASPKGSGSQVAASWTTHHRNGPKNQPPQQMSPLSVSPVQPVLPQLQRGSAAYASEAACSENDHIRSMRSGTGRTRAERGEQQERERERERGKMPSNESSLEPMEQTVYETSPVEVQAVSELQAEPKDSVAVQDEAPSRSAHAWQSAATTAFAKSATSATSAPNASQSDNHQLRAEFTQNEKLRATLFQLNVQLAQSRSTMDKQAKMIESYQHQVAVLKQQQGAAAQDKLMTLQEENAKLTTHLQAYRASMDRQTALWEAEFASLRRNINDLVVRGSVRQQMDATLEQVLREAEEQLMAFEIELPISATPPEMQQRPPPQSSPSRASHSMPPVSTGTRSSKLDYQPQDPRDPMDVAVCDILRGLPLSIRVEYQRLGKGDYIFDRRIALKMVNGHVLVRAAPHLIPLPTYLRELYEPFLLPSSTTTSTSATATPRGRHSLRSGATEGGQEARFQQGLRSRSPTSSTGSQSSGRRSLLRASTASSRARQAAVQSQSQSPLRLHGSGLEAHLRYTGPSSTQAEGRDRRSASRDRRAVREQSDPRGRAKSAPRSRQTLDAPPHPLLVAAAGSRGESIQPPAAAATSASSQSNSQKTGTATAKSGKLSARGEELRRWNERVRSKNADKYRRKRTVS